MKKLLFLLIFLLSGLLLVVLFNTWQHRPIERLAASSQMIEISKELKNTIVQHMSEAIQFKTISSSQHPRSAKEFNGFVDWIAEKYPNFIAQVESKKLGQYSLFFKWPGQKPSLKPVLLTGHYDVVPVIAGTESLWSHPPFSGKITDRYVWGRGALDDKSAIITLLEAASYLIQQGFKPQRSIYFAFGHDEEIGGFEGAASIAQHAKEKNLQFLWSLDEGSFMFDGIVPGVTKTLGTINVAEKGSVTLNIISTSEGGHSSMPPQQTAVGILAEALIKLEKSPMPGGLDGLSAHFLNTASRYMPFSKRLLFANQWLFKKLVEDKLSESTVMNAQLRTTTAPTMLSASPKANILPIEAKATVNFRIHPRDSIENIIQHVESTINNEKVRVERVGGWGNPASQVSSSTSEGYKVLVDSTYQVHPSVVLAPGLMIAASDSRHYSNVSDNSYRYNPMVITPDDLASFHGTNEKISIDNLLLATQIYIQIIKNGTAE
ncbi:MAG: M20 family peptidase [Kangiellaceae bacterium]|nr:M20 family peptidase [Kangiellaceae bacterium]